MHETAERLGSSLLYEGYALYPYTPAATKNATPTPFGIAYPTAYAERQPAAFDHVAIEVIAIPERGARIEASALFLQAEGERHRARERRVDLGPAAVEDLIAAPVERGFDFGGIEGSVRLSLSAAGDRMVRVALTVANATTVPAAEAEAMGRGEALARSLLSCHALLGIDGGRFASPLETEGELGAAVRACVNENSWPVLAAPDDTAVLGASYVLPDHPQISPQSNANLFDNTEIEEALVLHVQALSPAEREAIEDQDPAVREMVERAEATTQEELLGMHGLMKPAEAGLSFPEWSEPEPGSEAEPPVRPPPPGPADTAGEERLVVGEREFRRGGKVVLKPGTEGDPYDRMMDGRTATVERIYLDYEGRAYLGVSIDDDPMRDVLRDTGRYLFFFADEVEPA